MWFKEKQGATVHCCKCWRSRNGTNTYVKPLAIGADEAIRVNTPATDGYSVAKQLANVVKEGGYDLVIGGRESIRL